MSLFETSGLDLNAYFARVGFTGPAAGQIVRPDLATLSDLTLLHSCAIAFENLNPLLRRPVLLDIASIQQKLVRAGRGGWCFEHNLLLGAVLASLGYDVTGLSGRVVWNVAAGVVRARSHMVLLVTLDEGPYIVDVGFGGTTPTGPLRLEAGVEQATPHEPFRLTRRDSSFLLDVKLAGGWKGLYIFDLTPQVLADYEMPNWYLCNHPESHFLAGIVAARVGRGRRLALRGAELATYFTMGLTERRTLASGAEIRQVLEDLFNIRVPAGTDVDATLDRAASQADSS